MKANSAVEQSRNQVGSIQFLQEDAELAENSFNSHAPLQPLRTPVRIVGERQISSHAVTSGCSILAMVRDSGVNSSIGESG